jgi:plasmid maintenance system killer protein
MAWFDDKKLKDIYESGLARGVSSEECAIIRRRLAIPMAARSHTSHRVAGAPFSMPDGRLAVRVTPRWAISFEWIEEIGPFRMRLEAL